MSLYIPMPIFWGVSVFAHVLQQILGKTFWINLTRFKIYRQKSWLCNSQKISTELGYQPSYPLQKGLSITAKWYKEKKWL